MIHLQAAQQRGFAAARRAQQHQRGMFFRLRHHVSQIVEAKLFGPLPSLGFAFAAVEQQRQIDEAFIERVARLRPFGDPRVAEFGERVGYRRGEVVVALQFRDQAVERGGQIGARVNVVDAGEAGVQVALFEQEWIDRFAPLIEMEPFAMHLLAIGHRGGRQQQHHPLAFAERPSDLQVPVVACANVAGVAKNMHAIGSQKGLDFFGDCPVWPGIEDENVEFAVFRHENRLSASFITRSIARPSILQRFSLSDPSNYALRCGKAGLTASAIVKP